MVTKRRMKRVIKKYFQALEECNYQGIIKLFTRNAVVESPIYGKRKATDFYRDLIKKTKASKIKVYQIYKNSKSEAAYLQYQWTLHNNMLITFDCVDIFYFTDDGKISYLKTIYDTYKIRKAVKG